MSETLFLIAIVLVLVYLQFMAMSVMWQRFVRLLNMQEARTMIVEIRAFGPDPDAIARALARHTRLDLKEIDEIVEQRQTGPLPLPLPARLASLLVADLRALGTDAEQHLRSDHRKLHTGTNV
jgi:hypothetical protein